MPTLNLGVIEIPYENEGKKRPKKGRKKRATAKQVKSESSQAAAGGDGPTTTVQVAEILEEKYNVMMAYAVAHLDDMTRSVINSLDGALESLYMGHVPSDPFAEAGQEIQAGFRVFLMTAEIESMGVEGVPTQAALDRRSLRFKSKTANAQRPSFVDTGTYEAAMRAWIDS